MSRRAFAGLIEEEFGHLLRWLVAELDLGTVTLLSSWTPTRPPTEAAPLPAPLQLLVAPFGCWDTG